MEKRLRQKFVLVAMLSVAAALALILVVINAVNYQSVCRMAPLFHIRVQDSFQGD